MKMLGVGGPLPLRSEAKKIGLKFSEREHLSNLKPLTVLFDRSVDWVGRLLPFQNP